MDKKTILVNFPVYIIVAVLLISFAISIGVRMTIHVYEFEDMLQDAEQFVYFPYNDIEYANGIYEEISDFDMLLEDSQYVMTGTVTGERQVLYECIKTEVVCSKIYKGEQTFDKVYIYEPVGVARQQRCLTSFAGYNLLKEGGEYLFFLNETETAGEMHYVTPAYGSFPMAFNKDAYAVVPDEKQQIQYGEYKKLERFFYTSDDQVKYNEIYDRAMSWCTQ